MILIADEIQRMEIHNQLLLQDLPEKSKDIQTERLLYKTSSEISCEGLAESQVRILII